MKMNKERTMERYSLITEKIPREFLLLQGTGCFHKGCRFCHYYNDVSDNPFEVNKPEIEKITGEYGVLDIINSGSIHELDEDSMVLIAERVAARGIHTIWFETHYAYKNRLDEIKSLFDGVEVKFRTGVENFDNDFRVSMNKGFPDVTPQEIRKYFEGVCLLVCVKGQTKESIVRDINIAKENFDYFSVNVFCPNSTDVQLDEDLYNWFCAELYPQIKDIPNCEILIENTDLGVG